MTTGGSAAAFAIHRTPMREKKDPLALVTIVVVGPHFPVNTTPIREKSY
jgi:hypothetical protein